MKEEIKLTPGGRTVLCIGAHPDDSEFRCCGFAALCVGKGDRVVLMSTTDGSSGHMASSREELAKRRAKEAKKAAGLIGGVSISLGISDGLLEPSLENREKIIREIRKIQPDIIITNRLNDYHPDHRYTAELVQDASYMLMVPNVVPEVPALRYNPVVLYWGDAFKTPTPFKPAIVVDITSVFDKKIDMLYEHESQMFEWLPWIAHILEQVPPKEDLEGRNKWVRGMYNERVVHRFTELYPEFIKKRYKNQAMNVKECEAYEVSEYGYVPTDKELEMIFQGM